ncbi:hypothetical protein FOXYSP1_10523 [Fusarium oxysporum f. sp. phaseoli]
MGTYDHSSWRIRGPVRSPRVKPRSAGLVVGSVTTSEYLVLYVFWCLFLFLLLRYAQYQDWRGRVLLLWLVSMQYLPVQQPSYAS